MLGPQSNNSPVKQALLNLHFSAEDIEALRSGHNPKSQSQEELDLDLNTGLSDHRAQVLPYCTNLLLSSPETDYMDTAPKPDGQRICNAKSLDDTLFMTAPSGTGRAEGFGLASSLLFL